ncbi:MAG: universal stress protein [Chloroflexi bacterium]|nr:universal stress protein [Chloroflexota bacterium]
MFQRILVAFDGSANAWRALRLGITLARETNAAIWALSVEEPLPHYFLAIGRTPAAARDIATYFERLLAEAQREAAEQGVPLQTKAARGHAAQTIVDGADALGADLVVIGRHGHAGVLERILGSTTDRVVDLAKCSVLVVPGRRAIR